MKQRVLIRDTRFRLAPWGGMSFVWVLLLILWSGQVLGQAGGFTEIEGRVLDQTTNTPLVGATVEVQKSGATIGGAYTDEEGKFSVVVKESQDLTIKVSFVGYKTIRREYSSGADMTFSLEEDFVQSDEVVVVGYGSQERRDITGAVAGVEMEEVQNTSITNVDQALQGRTAGVMVTSNSGTPGGGMTIRVRGASSINSGNQPLFVIDGVPMITGDQGELSGDPNNNLYGGQQLDALASLNPNDIESIEVLKDASAAAIYGARASNGVVLITTKRGKAGKPKWNLNFFGGIQQTTKKLELLNTEQYLELFKEALANDGLPEAVWAQFFTDSTTDIDWLDEVLRTGSMWNTELSVSGGNERVRYYVGGTYLRNEGIQIGTSFERFTPRLNLDINATDKLKLGISTSYSYTTQQRTPNDNNIFGPIGSALLTPPNMAILPELAGQEDWYGLVNYLNSNPVGVAETDDNEVETHRLFANAFAEYEILTGLWAKVKFGADISDIRERIFRSPQISAAGTNGYSAATSSSVTKYIGEASLRFNRLFNQIHKVEGTVGIGAERNRRYFVSGYGEQFPSDELRYLFAASQITESESFDTRWAMNYMFARGGYILKDRYMVNVTFRADGSSRFGADNRFGYFPGISAGWRISEESFLKNVEFINDLKLRASWGLTGNQEGLGNFASIGLFGSGRNYNGNPGLLHVQLENPDLKWETTTMSNIGLDFTFLKERISITADFWMKNTTDLIYAQPVALSSGFTSSLTNLGEIENIGVDVRIFAQVLAPKQKGGFEWSVDVNLSHYQNEVVELFESQPINAGFGSRVEVGQPMGVFFGYEVEGVDPQTGDMVYIDNDGEEGITANDRVVIGNPHPDLTGGVTNILRFMNFELTMFWQFSVGNDILNYGRSFLEGMHNPSFNQTTAVLDRWQQPGDQTDVPRATAVGAAQNRLLSERFIEDGSYARLKNIILAYNFPQSMMERIGLGSLKLFVQAQNIITITGYSGFDPEANFQGQANVVMGTDFLTYPQAYTITGGVNIGF